MTIQPVKNNILFTFFKEDKKKGIGASKNQARLGKGTVLAIGDSVKEYAPGDVILFNLYSAKEILNEDNKQLDLGIIDKDLILAKYVKED